MTADQVAEGFKDQFGVITDPRIDRKRLFPLVEILFLVLTAILCGAKSWRAIGEFGHYRIDTLRLFFSYANGSPSDDTIRLVLRRLSPKAFQKCFREWVKHMRLPETLILAVDGKTSRRTCKDKGSPLHMVTAFASEANLILAQEKTAAKSNEIRAIPALLRVLDFSNSTVVVTIDAMGCQKNITEVIVNEKQADYCIQIKGNQPKLLKDITNLFDQSANNVDTYRTIEKNKGRIEERTCSVRAIQQHLKVKHNFAGLETAVMIESIRTLKGVTSAEKKYYISSLLVDAQTSLEIIRSHWGIENSVHWIMDHTFRDDESTLRRGNAPANMAIMKHFALNLLKKAQGPGDAINRLSLRAGWSQPELIRILSNLKDF